MRTLWLPLILCALVGCAEPVDPASSGVPRLDTCGPSEAGLERIELEAAPPSIADDASDLAPPTAEVVADMPCGCGDPRCLADWLDEQVGCDVCAHVRCGDSMVGACVRCDPSAGDDPWCVMPPADAVALPVAG